MSSTWTDLLRALGESFSVLMASEMSALRQDLAASRRKLFRALAIGGAAIFVLFLAIGAATVVIYEALAMVLDRWIAALIVLVFLLILGALLARIAVRTFESLESPVATVQRHVDDHVEWWQAAILDTQGKAGTPRRVEADSRDRQFGD